MPELIDRLSLIDRLDQGQKKALDAKDFMSFYALVYFKVILQEAPTIEAEPVRHGRWVETEPDEDDRKIGIEFSIKCSKCHDENSHLDFNENHEITGKTFWKSRFCPNCGAYMRGVSEDAAD